MEQSVEKQSVALSSELKEEVSIENSSGSDIFMQSGDSPCNCPSKGDANAYSREFIEPCYVYAVGRIEARFPRLDVEKEYMQARARAETAGKTDQEVFLYVISLPENRYLLRQLCWVLIIQGMETYILRPRNPVDFDLLLTAIRPMPSPDDIDAVIGVKGPIATPEMCNGLCIPVVGFDQIYSFKRDEFIKSIPVSGTTISTEQLPPAANEVFDLIMQFTDNAGATDEHRAMNYLAMRYPTIYTKTAERFERDFSLTSVETRLSSVSNVRVVVEVIFSYTNRNNDFTEKFFVRVDVAGEFPFLATRWSPYYDRC